MSKQDIYELEWAIEVVKLARQDMMNNPISSASNPVTAVLQAYDTLLAKFDEKLQKAKKE